MVTELRQCKIPLPGAHGRVIDSGVRAHNNQAQTRMIVVPLGTETTNSQGRLRDKQPS
jgi:hypothetical protein